MYIAIGRIIQTHGVQGFVKAISFAGLPDRFLNLKTIYMEIDQEIRGFIVEDVKLQNQVSLLKLKGVNTKEAAQFLVKNELLVPEDQKIDLPEDTFFVHDLIGLKVFDNTQQYLGELQEVLQNSGNDIYVIWDGDQEILIPAVSEFVKEINLREGKMIVQPIEGMVS